MIIGDKSTFAIESEITQAYERISFRALGYFVLYICGKSFGVKKADASMLALVFDEVERIIEFRGQHIASFASVTSAKDIVDAIDMARHGSNSDTKLFFGIPRPEFEEVIYSSHCAWHCAADEVFDDGSCVYHFDIGNSVRLIACKPRVENGQVYNNVWNTEKSDILSDNDIIVDFFVGADEFYGVLKQWHKAFWMEWNSASKILECDDQSYGKNK